MATGDDVERINPDRPSALLSRRAFAAAVAGVVASPHVGRAASLVPVRFSTQRSSALLALVREQKTLDDKFAAKGFVPSWSLFDNVIDPMNAGVVDFDADVADAVPIFTQAAGAPLTFYAREAPSPAAEAIIVKAESAIASVRDLKGKRVAVHRGSGCHFILVGALKRVGLSFADIEPAYLQPSAAASAFARGSVEAWAIWDPYLAIAESRMPTRTLCDASGLSSYIRYYTVANAFCAAHQDLVEIVFDALVATGTWVKQNPAEAARRLSVLWGGMPVPIVEIVDRRRSYAVEPVERGALGEQQTIADTFFAAGLIPRRIDTTSVPIWQPPGSRT